MKSCIMDHAMPHGAALFAARGARGTTREPANHATSSSQYRQSWLRLWQRRDICGARVSVQKGE